MPKKYVDQTGVAHIWSKIKALLSNKADIDFGNVTNDDFRDKAIDAGVGGLQTVNATSTDGVTYTATVEGVTALTAGLTLTIVPDTVSTTISVKLNINGLGDKYIRQSTTNSTATGLTPKNTAWMAANKPVTIQYDGTQWKTIAARSDASDMNGTVGIANGGTGATTAAAALENLGISGAITSLSVSGRTITYTKKDGTTGTITTQDTGAGKPYIIETWRNGTEWYRVWSNGEIEQGGMYYNANIANVNKRVTLHKPFTNTNYTILLTHIWGDSWSTNDFISAAVHNISADAIFNAKTTTQFPVNQSAWDGSNEDGKVYFYWEAKGR